jgi:hypothetical protein
MLLIVSLLFHQPFCLLAGHFIEPVVFQTIFFIFYLLNFFGPFTRGVVRTSKIIKGIQFCLCKL